MKSYIKPKVLILDIKLHNALMDMSVNSTTEINQNHAGLIKENNSSSSYNVWDDDWSN